MTLARRLNRPDGSFAGVVFAGVSSAHFRNLFAAIDLGVHGAISLRTTNLRLVARHPDPAGADSAIGSNRVSAQLQEALRVNPAAGAYVALTALDGIERVNAYRQVKSYPFTIIVGIPTDTWRTGARNDVIEFGALGGLAAVITLLSSWLLHLAWRHRESAVRAVARESARHQLLLRNASDGIHILDGGGHVLEASDSFCAMIGRSRAEVLGGNIAEWDMRWSGLELADMLRGLLQKRGNTVIETRHRLPGGGASDVEINVVAVAYDGRPALFCSARDITARKRAEQELLRLNHALEELAIHDAQTGLFNRRYLNEAVARELSQAARGGFPVSFILLDIDLFKAFNDTYGHQAGDHVLQAVGGLLRSSTRGGDIACRYGGEEFLLVLPNTPTAMAVQRAEELRAATEALPVSWDGQSLGIAISAGVATYPDHGATGDLVISRADAALYAAKSAGRNQVSAAGESPAGGGTEPARA